MVLDINAIREQFPALKRPAIFLDNPAGTQVAQPCLDRMFHYLTQHNANHGGAFTTSHLSDAVLDEAHAAVADFLNASRPEEIVFGPNMTSLTFNISRALGHLFKPGDEILVTPWMMVAEERGCRVRWVDFHPEDGTLDMEDFRTALESRPRLVAVGYASNALGTINPVEKIVKLAHEVGALVFVDAVQYASHGPVDVASLGCDFLACSAYKYSESQITRNIQFHRPPGHRKDKTVTCWGQIPKRVMGYNECLSPFSFSEYIQ